jgi:hypothetical protein
MIGNDVMTLFEVMWIGRDDKLCCHDKVYSVMCNGKDVTGSCHEQFVLLFGL